MTDCIEDKGLPSNRPPRTTTHRPSIHMLLRNGDIRRCAACHELSAYCWAHTTQKDEALRGGFEPDEVAHIGAADAFGWQCGHCRAHNPFRDAPILAECDTHQPPPRVGPLPRHARCAPTAKSAR